MSKKVISVVIPIYNSATIFPVLFDQLVDVFKSLNDYECEIIAVIDGCTDTSLELIAEYSKKNSILKYVNFSRNFGHQTAVTAGLEYAYGDYVVIMDDDLEDPPSVIINLVAKAEEGNDVVYAIRKKRKRSFFHKVLYLMFYRVFGFLANINVPYDSGDFCLMTKRVVESLNKMPERNRYVRGLRSWVGFKQSGIEYERGLRLDGKSGYSFKSYFKLAFNAVFSFSYKPLIYVSHIGIFISFISVVMAFIYLYFRLTGSFSDVRGWTSLFISLMFFSGLQLFSLGMIGQYIYRIYDEVKGRPIYIVESTSGFSK